MALARGLRIGDYLLLDRLGTGAFGEVWSADHAHLPRTVALKIARGERAVAMLGRETRAQFGLDHPGIVRVLDVHLGGAQPYAVLELVRGQSLRQLLDARGRLEVADAAAVLRQVTAALAYAHAQGVVHGDLKPENILVERPDEPSAGRARGWPPDAAAPLFGRAATWRVKLTDFQLGRIDAEGLPPRSGDGGVRQSLGTRGPLGTFRYMAPEQERDLGTVDHRVDFYAIGVLLFEMLTGSLPQGRDLPSDVNPQVSWWWDHIFSRCYTGRDRRYASAEEVLLDLDAVGHGPAWGDLPSQARPAAPWPARGHRSARGALPPEAAGHAAADEIAALCGWHAAPAPEAGGAAGAAAARGPRGRAPRHPVGASTPRPPSKPGLGVLVLGALAILAPLAVLRTAGRHPADRGLRASRCEPLPLMLPVRGAAPAAGLRPAEAPFAAAAPLGPRARAAREQAQALFRAYVDARRRRDDPLGADHKVAMTMEAAELRARIAALGLDLQDAFDLDAERYSVEMSFDGALWLRATWRPLEPVLWTDTAAASLPSPRATTTPRESVAERGPRLYGVVPFAERPVEGRSRP